jgi:hypothetical protein
MNIEWSEQAQNIFNGIIGNLPQFHRTIAQRLVKESAEAAVQQRGRAMVEEKDLIEAFFAEVPPAFRDMLKRQFKQLNIDYTNYIKE